MGDPSYSYCPSSNRRWNSCFSPLLVGDPSYSRVICALSKSLGMFQSPSGGGPFLLLEDAAQRLGYMAVSVPFWWGTLLTPKTPYSHTIPDRPVSVPFWWGTLLTPSVRSAIGRNPNAFRSPSGGGPFLLHAPTRSLAARLNSFSPLLVGDPSYSILILASHLPFGLFQSPSGGGPFLLLIS